jgi:selenide,water dikinase
VPFYPGAEALAAAGVHSTIFPETVAAYGARVFRSPSPASDLLFDPETGGGLLAAVPAGSAAGLVAEIRAQGLPAAEIGRIAAGVPGIAVA